MIVLKPVKSFLCQFIEVSLWPGSATLLSPRVKNILVSLSKCKSLEECVQKAVGEEPSNPQNIGCHHEGVGESRFLVVLL